jgi:nucleotide-binding universal stress UspA family protein
MSIRTILVGTDFAEPSLVAIDAAARWARHFDAAVVLVHAFDPSPPPSGALLGGSWPMVDLAAYEAATWKDLMELRRARLGKVREVRLAVLRHRSIPLAICDGAAEQHADLVVIGTHGRSGVSRVVLGSVAEQVVRHAPCPVMCVRGSEVPHHFPAALLLCTDFSPSAEAAVDMAADVAKQFESAVTVAHVYDEKRWERPPEPGFEGDIGAAIAELHGHRFDQGIHTAVLRGPVAETLCAFAKKQGTDLMVLATHGRTGLGRMVIGSVAERVTRHAPCSVLVTRARDLAP